MTVNELNQKIEGAAAVRDRLDDIGKHIKAITKILEAEKVDPDVINKVRAETYEVTRIAFDAKCQIADYKTLLDDITRSTQITWPPVCQNPDETAR